MYPFERFTPNVKRALTLAKEEAELAQHSYIGTEHIILGLLRVEDGVAARALDGLGVEDDAVRERVMSVLGRNQAVIISTVIPTSRVKTVIELSFQIAQQMGDAYVDTEHLLLGLVREGQDIAAQVLEDMGATLSAVEAAVLQLRGVDAG